MHAHKQNYNRVFLQLARSIKEKVPTAEGVAAYLRELRGESTEWPSDETFRLAWEGREIYRTLSAPRIVFLLSKLNGSFASSKTETITIDEPLSIEHLMPQSWIANWPLPDGSRGIDEVELWDLSPDDGRAKLTQERNSFVDTIGNLTIVRQGLNAALSNSGWPEKKQQLMGYSLLPINLPLQGMDTWDEERIIARSRELFSRALKIWPR